MNIGPIGPAIRGALLVSVLGASTMAWSQTAASDETVRGVNGERIPAHSAMASHDGSWEKVRVIGLNHRLDNTLYFAPDGRVRVEYTDTGQGTEGTWAVEEGNICLQLEIRGRECWPYVRLFQAGETVELTSSLGLRARVTMVTDPSDTPMAHPRAGGGTPVQ